MRIIHWKAKQVLDKSRCSTPRRSGDGNASRKERDAFPLRFGHGPLHPRKPLTEDPLPIIWKSSDCSRDGLCQRLESQSRRINIRFPQVARVNLAFNDFFGFRESRKCSIPQENEL